MRNSAEPAGGGLSDSSLSDGGSFVGGLFVGGSFVGGLSDGGLSVGVTGWEDRRSLFSARRRPCSLT